jgi:hypothetical protein
MDWYIFLTPLLLLPIIFLFRLVGCGLDTSGVFGRPDDGDGGDDGATTYTLTGPDTLEAGVDSKDFTVSLPPGQTVPEDVTVMPDNGGRPGTFTPATVVLTKDSPSASATFIYHPDSDGATTISTTNDKGLTNPPSLNYDVSTPPSINITFKLIIVDPIPQIQPNPIIYIWPRFRVDDGGSGPSINYVSDPILEPPVTWESVAIQVPAGNHTCYCDLFMLRLDMDVTIDPNNPNLPPAQLTEESINANPDHQAGQHLTGPAIVDQGFVADTDITFNLHYTQSDPDATDYNLDDFSLEVIIA